MHQNFALDKKIKLEVEKKLEQIKNDKNENIMNDKTEKAKQEIRTSEMVVIKDNVLQPENIKSEQINDSKDIQSKNTNNNNSNNKLENSIVNSEITEITDHSDKNNDNEKKIVEDILSNFTILRKLCDLIFDLLEIEKDGFNTDDFNTYLTLCDLELPYFYKINSNQTTFYIRNFDRLLNYLMCFKNCDYFPRLFKDGNVHFISKGFSNYCFSYNPPIDKSQLNVFELKEFEVLDDQMYFFNLYKRISNKITFDINIFEDQDIILDSIQWKYDVYSSSYFGTTGHLYNYYYCYFQTGQLVDKKITSYSSEKSSFLKECKNKVVSDGVKPIKFSNPIQQILYGVFNNPEHSEDRRNHILTKLNDFMSKFNCNIELDQSYGFFFIPRFVRVTSATKKTVKESRIVTVKENKNEKFILADKDINLDDLRSLLGDKLYKQLKQRLFEAKVNYENECYLSCIVQIGSILEGICFAAFQTLTNHDPSMIMDISLIEEINKTNKTINKLQPKNKSHLTLEISIDYLKNKKILNDLTSQYTLIIRMLRNLVHPFHLNFEYPDKNTCEIAFLLLINVIKDVSNSTLIKK